MNALVRPVNGRVIGGVCAALAGRFGLGVPTVRVLTVISVLLGFPVLLYLVLWLVIPSA